jgi:hypothetical protein
MTQIFPSEYIAVDLKLGDILERPQDSDFLVFTMLLLRASLVMQEADPIRLRWTHSQ